MPIHRQTRDSGCRAISTTAATLHASVGSRSAPAEKHEASGAMHIRPTVKHVQYSDERYDWGRGEGMEEGGTEVEKEEGEMEEERVEGEG